MWVGKLNTIGADNDLSPCRCQAIIWTNDNLSLRKNVSETLIEIHRFSYKIKQLENGGHFNLVSMC